MKKSLILSLSIVVILIGGYFVVQKNFIKNQTSKPTEKFTICFIDNPVYAFILIAKNKGFFTDEGLDVTLSKNFTSGPQCISDLLAGNSDLAVSYETPFIRAIFEDNNIFVITTMHSSTKNSAVVGRRDKGIRTLNDLKGKNVGVNKGTVSEFFLYSLLQEQGLPLSEITEVNMGFPDMPIALKDNKIDAVSTANPWFFEIIQSFPPSQLAIFQSETYTEMSLLLVRAETIKNKKEALYRFMRALVKAEDIYKQDNNEALKIVIAELPSLPAKNISSIWKQSKLELKLDNVLLTILNREARWLKNEGAYQNDIPDFKNVIFTDFLKEVSPEAVTVY